jgi:hypothetical protein
VAKLAKVPATQGYKDSVGCKVASKAAEQEFIDRIDNQAQNPDGQPGVPNKQEIYEAWREYKERAHSTAQPRALVETAETR